eukprot:TRINITY_DN14634_c0_g1_i1.p1 TRINITY_DN14634_c0_g1~~TRINITY_DN14634_c0_g1_i1.p1  ORF type:complete len:297 (+),score=97.20 TRINITY_DN14634_c0_g1_i1:272-1162(+)
MHDRGDFCLSPARVAADVARLAALTPRVRLYSLACDAGSRALLNAARSHGLTVDAGVWVGRDAAAVGREVALLGRLLAEGYGDVLRTVWVGNEAMSIHRVPQAAVVSALRRVGRVRAAAGVRARHVRVGIAEIGDFWRGNTPNTAPAKVAALADVLGVQSHPYYAGIDPLTTDASWLALSDVAAARAAHPGKVVALSETGFPTRGHPRPSPGGWSTATPSVAAAGAYAAQMEAARRRTGLESTWIGLADDAWKRRWAPAEWGGGVTYAWGLLSCGRVDKGIPLPPPAGSNGGRGGG